MCEFCGLSRASRNLCGAGRRRQVVIGRLSVAPPVICWQLEELLEATSSEQRVSKQASTSDQRVSAELVVCGFAFSREW